MSRERGKTPKRNARRADAFGQPSRDRAGRSVGLLNWTLCVHTFDTPQIVWILYPSRSRFSSRGKQSRNSALLDFRTDFSKFNLIRPVLSQPRTLLGASLAPDAVRRLFTRARQTPLARRVFTSLRAELFVSVRGLCYRGKSESALVTVVTVIMERSVKAGDACLKPSCPGLYATSFVEELDETIESGVDL